MAETSAAPSAKRAVPAAEPTVGRVGEPDQFGAITSSRFIATTSSSWSPGTGTRAGAGTHWAAVGAGGGVGVATVSGAADAPSAAAGTDDGGGGPPSKRGRSAPEVGQAGPVRRAPFDRLRGPRRLRHPARRTPRVWGRCFRRPRSAEHLPAGAPVGGRVRPP